VAAAAAAAALIADDVMSVFSCLPLSNLEDNWNDAEGYYVTRIGEVIAGRFQVMMMMREWLSVS